jgi:peptidoglycan/xylan/chitin deacetylase (PgdA/CDA1 family)
MGVARAAPVAWSQSPPGGLTPAQVPQFVAVTFDDGYGLENGGSGGVNFIVDFMSARKNSGGGNAGTFDGTPVRTTFYLSSSNGADAANRAAWTKAFKDGHEAADHTINHPNGGTLDAGGTPPGRFAITKWVSEIKGCRDALTGGGGITATAADIVGFRTPFLGYNDNTFGALAQLGFSYDSTFPNCFGDGEDGGSCSWPHTLDAASKDAETLTRKAGAEAIKSHPGLMEVPVSTVFVPAELRAKIPAKMPYPSLWEPATGKLGGLDWTVLMDAKLTPDEMTTVLEHTLDLHLAGNRAPFVFCAHTFMYSYSSPGSNPDTPSVAVRDARWKALTAFLTYALSKPEVRMRPVKDIVAWMQKPVALNGAAPAVDAGGTPQSDAAATDGGKTTADAAGAEGGSSGADSGAGGGSSARADAAVRGGSGGAGAGSGGEGGDSGEGGSAGGAKRASSGGCHFGGGANAGGPTLVLLALVALLSRRRR